MTTTFVRSEPDKICPQCLHVYTAAEARQQRGGKCWRRDERHLTRAVEVRG